MGRAELAPGSGLTAGGIPVTRPGWVASLPPATARDSPSWHTNARRRRARARRAARSGSASSSQLRVLQLHHGSSLPRAWAMAAAAVPPWHASVGVPAAPDWWCAQCSYSNWARRRQCYSCKAPRLQAPPGQIPPPPRARSRGARARSRGGSRPAFSEDNGPRRGTTQACAQLVCMLEIQQLAAQGVAVNLHQFLAQQVSRLTTEAARSTAFHEEEARRLADRMAGLRSRMADLELQARDVEREAFVNDQLLQVAWHKDAAAVAVASQPVAPVAPVTPTRGGPAAASPIVSAFSVSPSPPTVYGATPRADDVTASQPQVAPQRIAASPAAASCCAAPCVAPCVAPSVALPSSVASVSFPGAMRPFASAPALSQPVGGPAASAAVAAPCQFFALSPQPIAAVGGANSFAVLAEDECSDSDLDLDETSVAEASCAASRVHGKHAVHGKHTGAGKHGKHGKHGKQGSRSTHTVCGGALTSLVMRGITPQAFQVSRRAPRLRKRSRGSGTRRKKTGQASERSSLGGGSLGIGGAAASPARPLRATVACVARAGAVVAHTRVSCGPLRS